MPKPLLADTMVLTEQQSTMTMAPPPNSDETTLAAVLREIDALAMTRKTSLNIDVQVVVPRIRATLRRIKTHPVYLMLKQLASKGLFDFEVLNRLTRYTPALWLAGHHARQERQKRDRLITEEVSSRAMVVRSELTRIAQYHFGRDPVEATTVNAITNVSDHLRMANDLRYLHDLLTRHASKMMDDPFYREGVVREANELANSIIDSFDHREDNQVRWVERAGALWALVKADYAELVTVGRFLLRANPEEGLRMFPNALPTRTRGRKAANDDADGDDSGIDEDEVNEDEANEDEANEDEVNEDEANEDESAGDGASDDEETRDDDDVDEDDEDAAASKATKNAKRPGSVKTTPSTAKTSKRKRRTATR